MLMLPMFTVNFGRGRDPQEALYHALTNQDKSAVVKALEAGASLSEPFKYKIKFLDQVRGTHSTSLAEMLVKVDARVSFIKEIRDLVSKTKSERPEKFLIQLLATSSNTDSHSMLDIDNHTHRKNRLKIADDAFNSFLTLKKEREAQSNYNPLDFELPIGFIGEASVLKKILHEEGLLLSKKINATPAVIKLLKSGLMDIISADRLLKQVGHRLQKTEIINVAHKNKVHQWTDTFSQPMSTYAILAGDSDEVLAELKQNRHSSETPSQGGDKTAKAGTEAFKSQLAWINQPVIPFGWTPLAAALDQKKWALVDELLLHQAHWKAEIQDDCVSQKVPLVALMAFKNNTEAVTWLLQKEVSVADLNQRYKHKKWGRVTPLVVAALEGNEEMVDLLLKAGVNSQVFSGSELKKIAKDSPHIRQKLGAEGLFESFSRHISQCIGVLSPKKEVARSESARIEGSHQGGAKQENGSALESVKSLSDLSDKDQVTTLSLDRVKQGLENLHLPASQLEQCVSTLKAAERLTAFGELPLQGDDAVALKRMWHVNVPLLIQRLAGIPQGDRESVIEAGQPSALTVLSQSFLAIDKSMAAMRERALIKAHRQLSIEMDVLQDQAAQAVSRFEEDLVSQKEQQLMQVEPPAARSDSPHRSETTPSARP